MNPENYKYIPYQNERDVIFFFGAGSSYAEGVPIQSGILKYILTDKKIRASHIGKHVIDFLNDYFWWDEEKEIFPSIESVFGLLENSIRREEGLSEEYPDTAIIGLREKLIKLIHYVIGKFKGSDSQVYKYFWNSVKGLNRNVTIITTNYDTLLDEAFDLLYPDYGYIDYCLHFMNYDHYEKIDAFNWWVDPRRPVPVWGKSDPVPIKIIKVHGSLNWKYCNVCGQVLLTPWQTNIDLSTGIFVGDNNVKLKQQREIQHYFKCPIDGSFFKTLIVHPTYYKPLIHPEIISLMQEAGREIRMAKKIVFIGYSFPESDVHLKSLLHRNLLNRPEIVVINPTITPILEMSYKALSKECKFMPYRFEELIDDNEVMNKLFTI